MLTAPVLLSAIPESFNCTKLVFSSTYALSDAGISFNTNFHEYAGIFTGIYPTFNSFFTSLSATQGTNLSRSLKSDDFSRAHISYFKDNVYEILDFNPLQYDIQALQNRTQRIYNVTVLSSVGATTTALMSNSLSAAAPAIPLMYSRSARTAITDWVTVPLVAGRKAIYVADALATPAGSDSNDGLTTATPKLSVSAAFNLLNPGDHIYFKRGSKWTNQAFGGTADRLPSNLCASGKSGSAIDCPTLVAAYGSETDPLPMFEVTTSTISTFFLADNDDQYAGLKNFYVKCLHFTASGRDVREEQNGDDYPSFFTLLNTGGSAVAAGVSSSDAHSDNILIEGCTLQEIGNAIIMNASYNSLVAGADGKYNWGTSNFVSSYDASVGPACLTNILIRRNIFKDLYFLPQGSFPRTNTANYINYVNSQGGPIAYHLRIGAILASFGKQPKAIYLYGTSGTANMVDGNIFYRCGNKAETYPDTYDRQVATVHSEGGFNGISVIRNIFYKCANIAVKQLDGGANINNIYFRNPHAITMLGDIGLTTKKTYQGVPTSETFGSVSAGLPVSAVEGGFVPYWYFFDKNNALSIITKNIIEEPQDVGYNISVISGSNVTLNSGGMTVVPKSTGIEILGGTVKAIQNYIGNITKGVSTGRVAAFIKGFEVNLDHFNRGASSVTHASAPLQYSNKIAFDSNVINNHGTVQVKNFASDLGRSIWWNNFESSALAIRNNTIRNAVWNYNAPLAGLNSLSKDAGENYLTVFGESLQATVNRTLFTGNKIGFNPGKDFAGNSRRRGIEILPSILGGGQVGEFPIEQASSLLQSFFGTTLAQRLASVSSNTFTDPRSLQSLRGDGTNSWLENYLQNVQNLAIEGRDSEGWTIISPYFSGTDPLNVNSTRVWYVDPENGLDLYVALNNTSPIGWSPDTGTSLGVTSLNGVTYEIGRHPQAPIKDLGLAYRQLRHDYPDWILIKRGTKANVSARYATKPFWRDTAASAYHYHGNRTDSMPGLLFAKSGPSNQNRIVIGSYGPGAESPLVTPNNANWLGSNTIARPQLVMYTNAANSGRTRYQDIDTFITFQNGYVGGAGGDTVPYAPFSTTPYQSVQNINVMSIEFRWEDDPSYTDTLMFKNFSKVGTININPNGIAPNFATGRPGSSARNMRFEDIRIFNTHSGFNILGAASGLDTRNNTQVVLRNVAYTDHDFITPSSYASGLEIRRCQFDSLWCDFDSSTSHEDFIYGEGIRDLLVEDCIADRVSTKETYLTNPVRRHQQPPQSRFTAHHVYFQPSVIRPTFRNNIFAKSVFDALQLRGGGIVTGNLFLKMPVAVTMIAAASSITNIIKDNVMMNSYQAINMPATLPVLPGGRFLELQLGTNTLVQDNIVYRTHDPLTLSANIDKDGGTYQSGAMVFGGRYTPGSIAVDHPVRSVRILNNIIYNWGGTGDINSLQTLGQPVPPTQGLEFLPLGFQNIDNASSITMRGNHFLYTEPTGIHRTSYLSNSISFGGAYQNFASGGASAIFDVGDNKFTFSSIKNMGGPQINSLLNVLNLMNDNTSVFGNNVSHYYPNPYRSLLTYIREMDTLAPVFTNSRDGEVLAQEYFINKCLVNRKGNWDSRWTSQAVVNYIREGFGKPAINSSFTDTEEFFTSAITNLACNNSSIDFNFFPQNLINAQIGSLTSVTFGRPVPTGGGEVLPPAVQPSFNNNFIDNLEGQIVIQSDIDAVVTIKNNLAQPVTAYVLDATGEEKQITIPSRKVFVTNKSLVTEALEDVVRKYKLPVLTDDLGAVERTIGSIPDPKITTVAEVRNDIGTLREQLTNIISNAGITRSLDELIYGETKENFYSDKEAAQTTQGAIISDLISVGFPVILNRRNTLLVAGDFMKYAQSVLKDEYKILSLASDETPLFLLNKYKARIALMDSDRSNYYDSVFVTKAKTVDQVYYELGLSFTEPSEQDATE